MLAHVYFIEVNVVGCRSEFHGNIHHSLSIYSIHFARCPLYSLVYIGALCKASRINI